MDLAKRGTRDATISEKAMKYPLDTITNTHYTGSTVEEPKRTMQIWLTKDKASKRIHTDATIRAGKLATKWHTIRFEVEPFDSALYVIAAYHGDSLMGYVVEY